MLHTVHSRTNIGALLEGEVDGYVYREFTLDDGGKLILFRYLGDAREAFIGAADIFLSAMLLTALLSVL